MKPVFALPTISTDLLCFRLERFYWKFCQVLIQDTLEFLLPEVCHVGSEGCFWGVLYAAAGLGSDLKFGNFF